jgi:hypothetical protein
MRKSCAIHSEGESTPETLPVQRNVEPSSAWRLPHISRMEDEPHGW